MTRAIGREEVRGRLDVALAGGAASVTRGHAAVRGGTLKSATVEVEEMALIGIRLSGTLLANSAGWVTKEISRQRGLRAMRSARRESQS